MRLAGTMLGLVLLLGSHIADARDTTARNVLLVTLDTTRADHIGCYGYDRDTSPTIDGVAADAVVFANAYTVIPLTTPSHVSIMTGLHPVNHGVYRNSHSVPEDLTTMAELLAEREFVTGAFVSAIVLSGRSRIDDGFEVYSEVLGTVGRMVEGPPGRMRSADETVEAALDWLAQLQGERFFLWLHLYEPHLPYLPPATYGRKFDPDFDEYRAGFERRRQSAEGPARYDDDQPAFLPGAMGGDRPGSGPHEGRPPRGFPRTVDAAEVESMRNAYDGEIAFADAELAKILGFLKKEGLYDETAVVITGDHGEILYEKREYFGHHEFMYEGSLRVPLVWKFPGIAARSIEERITNLDILPTLLDALGIESETTTDGISFWPLIRHGRQVTGRPYEVLVSHTRRPGSSEPVPDPGRIFNPTGVLKDGWKLLVTSRGDEPGTTLELFDLNSDPTETKNLYDAETKLPIARELRAHLDSELEKAERLIQPEAMDPETRERLRSLGYLP